MDPNATLREILEALPNDLDGAEKAARNLLAWIDHNGFAPDLGRLDSIERSKVTAIFCLGVIAGRSTAS